MLPEEYFQAVPISQKPIKNESQFSTHTLCYYSIDMYLFYLLLKGVWIC